MFDRLEDLARSLEEINMQLTDPDVINDQNKYRQLMKEQSELTPIVEKYQEYRAAKDGIEESLQILEEENDEEMRELITIFCRTEAPMEWRKILIYSHRKFYFNSQFHRFITSNSYNSYLCSITVII